MFLHLNLDILSSRPRSHFFSPSTLCSIISVKLHSLYTIPSHDLGSRAIQHSFQQYILNLLATDLHFFLILETEATTANLHDILARAFAFCFAFNFLLPDDITLSIDRQAATRSAYLHRIKAQKTAYPARCIKSSLLSLLLPSMAQYQLRLKLAQLGRPNKSEVMYVMQSTQ